MAEKLNKILEKRKNMRDAVTHGTAVHNKLQFVFIDGADMRGDAELCEKIIANPDLHPFFTSQSQTEVPLAGFVGAKFISRRIDRMLINHNTKTIDVLDYKTDSDKSKFRNEYKAKMAEYISLLTQIHPGYSVRGYLLWLHDWTLEQIY